MAPEQHERGTADTRSDQYALCVVLWEALYGATKALVEAKQRAHLRRPSSSVPDWVHTAIVRGLAAAPEKRWPSVDALVDALALGQSRTRRRRVFAGFGLATCVALGGVSWQQWDRSRHVAACERAGESIAEVWNDDIREGLRSALVGTGVSHAEETADKVMPWFDGQAQDWQTAQTETCLAAEVHDTWDADLLDRGLWCLEERRMEFEALVTELSSGEAKSVEAAVPAAAGLRQVGPCRDGDLLRRRSSPPKERRDEIRSVRAELSRATALQQTGAYDEGLALVRDALSRAESLKWPPLIAEAYFGLGALLESTGDYEGATETLEAAYFGATKAGGAPEVAVAAAVQLVYVVGYRLARNEEGLRWSRHAEVALASAPDLAQIRKATLLGNLANLDHAKGAYENAKTLYERALAIRETALGPEHPQVATILNNLAAAHRATGANAEAKALYEHGLAILENALGPEHPMVATILSNLGNVYASMGSFEEAKALHGRALVIQEKALGPEHSDLASSLNNLASVHHDIGENEEAKTLYERALVIQEKALGPEHPRVATSLNNLANVQHDIGADETAKTLHERALAIREQALGPEHPDVASSLENLAEVHHATGAHEEAKSLYERALAIREQALGSEHPSVTNALIGLGNVALAQHRAGDGVLLVERAVRLREATRARTIDIAETRFLLGQTLWESNRERPRAVDLAEQARDAYQDAGATELADVEAWLAIHEGSQ
jgi:serine/threonine-protein kinase